MAHLHLNDLPFRLTGAHRLADTRALKRGDVADSWAAASPVSGEPQQYYATDAGVVRARASELAYARRTKKLADLCSYFEHRDHVQLRNRLAAMTGAVAAAVATYGDSQDNILEIDRIYVEFRRKLWAHMFREEGFYNSIRNVEQQGVKPFCASSILIGAIRVLRREHRVFAKKFRRIANLLRDYTIPSNAGQKYRDLVHGFRELEAFKLQHVHKENIMYSRALAIENQLFGN